MPWPQFEQAPVREPPCPPLWRSLLWVVILVLASVWLLSRCAHAGTFHPACTSHCTNAARQATTCVLRKIGGSWVKICG